MKLLVNLTVQWKFIFGILGIPLIDNIKTALFMALSGFNQGIPPLKFGHCDFF